MFNINTYTNFGSREQLELCGDSTSDEKFPSCPAPESVTGLSYSAEERRTKDLRMMLDSILNGEPETWSEETFWGMNLEHIPVDSLARIRSSVLQSRASEIVAASSSEAVEKTYSKIIKF